MDDQITAVPALLAGLPADWQAIRREHMALAMDWRTKTRLLLGHYSAQGYTVTGYATSAAGERLRSCYLRERQKRCN
jgi:predicted GNAT superfamily acetyltransferase